MTPIRRGFQVFASLILIAGLAGTTVAADVTLTLEVNTFSQTWRVFGEASLGDNDGLASVGFDMWDVDFPVDLMLPASWNSSLTLAVDGFVQGRTDTTNPLGANQNTFMSSGLVYGFGQTAGSLSDSVADVFVQKDYDAKLLLAKGTYPAPSVLPEIDNAEFRVFPIGGGTPFTPTVTMSRSFIPEPASVTLLMFGLAAVLWRARRRNG